MTYRVSTLIINKLRRPVIYISGGLISAVVDIATLKFSIWIGFSTQLSIALGFITGLFINFIFHKLITFKSRSNFFVVIKYLTVVVVNYLITIIVVEFLIFNFGFDVVVGKLASLPLVAVNGFLLGKYWIFKK